MLRREKRAITANNEETSGPMTHDRRKTVASRRRGVPVGVLLMALAIAACASVSPVTPAPAPPLLSTTPQTANPSATPEATPAAVSVAQPAPVASLTVLPAAPPSPAPSLVATSTATLTATPLTTATATPTPGPTPDGVARTLQVPILMYHRISVPPADADIYRRDLSVSPDRFEEQLRYLADAGYHTILLDDLLYALAQGRPLPDKPVILTFDDGYEDNYTEAFPLLRRYGMVGHFFIITDFVNQERPDYMTWPQIEEMSAAGQRFGSHSRDHPNLSGKSVDYLVWQALGSQEAIVEHLGYHPRWIVYPLGYFDQQTIVVFKSADYWGGLVTEQGATHTLAGIFELNRVRVRGGYTVEELGRLLVLDW